MKINNLKYTLTTILTTTALSLFLGVVFCYDKLKIAADHILDNKYIHYKMFRLAALHIKKPLVDLIITILIINIILIILYILRVFLAKKAVKFKFVARIAAGRGVRIFFVSLYVLSMLIFIYNKFITKEGRGLGTGPVNFFSLLLVTGLLLLLGWALFTLKWERIFKTKVYKYTVRLTVSLILLLFVFTAAVHVYSGSDKVPAGPNIVLIVIDCLRADHLGCYGYSKETSPHIDDLSEKGTLFKKAYSNAPWTKPSVASILTALYPNKHNAVNMTQMLPDEALTIAEILQNGGYQTFFFNGGNANITKNFNFHQGIDTYINQPRADRLTRTFLSKISNLRKDDRFFAYIHYMDLHLPYHNNPFYKIFLKNRENSFFKNRKITVGNIRLFTEKNCISPEEKSCLMAMYDSQIRFVDSAIHDILSTLKKKKIYEETLIVVTSDHGEEFWDHNNFEHGHTVYNELLHVPLIIAGNKAGNSEVHKPVNLVDIMPTILDAARVSIDTLAVQGRDLFKPGNRPVFSMGSLYGDEKFCFIKNNMKIIFNSGNKKGKKGLEGPRSTEKFELYNLRDDPVETVNLRVEKRALFLRLKKELQKFIKAGSSRLKGKRVQIDKDEKLKKQLKSLGYL